MIQPEKGFGEPGRLRKEENGTEVKPREREAADTSDYDSRGREKLSSRAPIRKKKRRGTRKKAATAKGGGMEQPTSLETGKKSRTRETGTALGKGKGKQRH